MDQGLMVWLGRGASPMNSARGPFSDLLWLERSGVFDSYLKSQRLFALPEQIEG